MALHIDFGEPVLDRKQAEALTCGELNDFYCAASEVEGLNLFFVLLASLHHYEDAGERALAAYLSFLTAYYLFTPLTPPGSWTLAMHYVEKAVRLDPQPEYLAWRELMRAGN